MGTGSDREDEKRSNLKFWIEMGVAITIIVEIILKFIINIGTLGLIIIPIFIWILIGVIIYASNNSIEGGGGIH